MSFRSGIIVAVTEKYGCKSTFGDAERATVMNMVKAADKTKNVLKLCIEKGEAPPELWRQAYAGFQNCIDALL